MKELTKAYKLLKMFKINNIKKINNKIINVRR